MGLRSNGAVKGLRMGLSRGFEWGCEWGLWTDCGQTAAVGLRRDTQKGSFAAAEGYSGGVIRCRGGILRRDYSPPRRDT